MRTRSIFGSLSLAVVTFFLSAPVSRAAVVFGDQNLLPMAPMPTVIVTSTVTSQTQDIASLRGTTTTTTTTPTATTPTTTTPVLASAFPALQPTAVLRMSDGSYYHPGTGIKTATKEEMQAKLAAIGYVMAPEAIEQPPIPSIIGITPEQEPALIAVFGRAMTLLQAKLDDQKKAHPEVQYATTDTGWRDITLAVWDKNTDQITLLTGQKKGTGLKIEDGDMNLRVAVSNGLNSEFVSADKTRYLVVGILYPIYTEEKLTKKKVRYRIEDVLYVPLSDGFHSDAMVTYGQEWLDGAMKRVFEQFDRQQVRSRAFPDKLVSEVIDRNLLLSILAIEHMDQSSLTNNQDHTLDRFFVTLAVNGDQAYAFSGSSAGALGIAQFMPKTYAGLVKQRSGVGLITNFEQGMHSVENSIRAQALYLDTLLSEMPLDARMAFFNQSPEEVREYIVAAYNGGAPRITTAISFWTQAAKATATAFAPADRLANINTIIAQRQAQIAVEPLKSRVQAFQRDINDLKKEATRIQTAMKAKKKPTLKTETVSYLKKYRILRTVIANDVI